MDCKEGVSFAAEKLPKMGVVKPMSHSILNLPALSQPLSPEAPPTHLKPLTPEFLRQLAVIWVAVKELSFSYYVGETLLSMVTYTHHGDLVLSY